MALLGAPRTRGLALILAGLLLVVVPFGASWATADERTTVSTEVDPENTTTLVGVQGPARGGNVTLLDGNGTTMWTYSDDAISYQDVSHLDPREVERLERQGVAEDLSNRTVLATFAAGDYEQCGPYEPPCKRTGIRLIDPVPEPHVAYEWSYPVRTRKDSEVHDAELLPSGELLVADMEYESIFTVNLTTGERTWTWNASSRYAAPADPTKEDWLHINDVDRIGPDRYLVSVRNTNQLLVVERGAGVVEVINRDRDPAILNEQHNPHWLGDGEVLVADSENHRVVELHRNDSTGEWEVAWSVSRAAGIAFDWPRDADRLPNGNTLVTDSRNNRVVEIAPNGSLVASYATRPLPYEADRIPHGELSGSAHASDGSDVEGAVRGDLPVLTPLLAGAHHQVGLPYWVSELHVAAVIVAVGLWGYGLHVTLRGR